MPRMTEAFMTVTIPTPDGIALGSPAAELFETGFAKYLADSLANGFGPSDRYHVRVELAYGNRVEILESTEPKWLDETHALLLADAYWHWTCG